MYKYVIQHIPYTLYISFSQRKNRVCCDVELETVAKNTTGKNNKQWP